MTTSATDMATKKARMGIYLDPEIIDRLQALATRKNRSANSLAELFIIEGLEREGLVKLQPLPDPITIERDSKEDNND